MDDETPRDSDSLELGDEKMRKALSILVADTDADFGESLVNNLLLLGVPTVRVAQNGTEVVTHLEQNSFDLVLVELDIFEQPETKSTLDRCLHDHSTSIILMLDEDRTSLSQASKSGDFYLCTLKSSVRNMLGRIVEHEVE